MRPLDAVKYTPISPTFESGTRRSRCRSQIVVNDTLGDSGDSVLSKYVSVLQRVAFPILLLFTLHLNNFITSLPK